MKKILKILSVEKRLRQKDGEPYYITKALIDFPEDDPRHEEVFEGYGRDFKEGQKVECWFSDRYNKPEMQSLGLWRDDGKKR